MSEKWFIFICLFYMWWKSVLCLCKTSWQPLCVCVCVCVCVFSQPKPHIVVKPDETGDVFWLLHLTVFCNGSTVELWMCDQTWRAATQWKHMEEWSFSSTHFLSRCQIDKLSCPDIFSSGNWQSVPSEWQRCGSQISAPSGNWASVVQCVASSQSLYWLSYPCVLAI